MFKVTNAYDHDGWSVHSNKTKASLLHYAHSPIPRGQAEGRGEGKGERGKEVIVLENVMIP